MQQKLLAKNAPKSGSRHCTCHVYSLHHPKILLEKMWMELLGLGSQQGEL